MRRNLRPMPEGGGDTRARCGTARLVAHERPEDQMIARQRIFESELCRGVEAERGLYEKTIARRFDELTAPNFTKIRANVEESRTLATLREELLPKLLKGEITIPSH